MLGVNHSVFGDDVPGLVRPLLQLQHTVVLDDFRASFFGGAGVGPDRAGCVDVALPVGPHAAEHALGVDDRAGGLDLLRRDQAYVLDADGLEPPIVRLKPFPPLGRRGDVDPARHVHPDRVARFRFDLLEQIDRVGLKDRHVRIGVERMESARRVPRGAGGQNGALHQRNIGPVQFRKMVKNRGADDPAPNDHSAVVRFHARSSKNRQSQRLANSFQAV